MTNLLAFKSLRLGLAPLTLLSGANSAGKTSVLRSIALLRQSADARTLPEALVLNGSLVRLGTGRDILHSDAGVRGRGNAVTIRIELSAEDRWCWEAEYEREADALHLLSAPVSGLPPELEVGFQYLTADRLAPAVTYPKSHEATTRRFLGPRGENAANVLRVHGDVPVPDGGLVHQLAAGPTLLENVNGWLSEISPGTSVAVADVEGTDYVRLLFRRRTAGGADDASTVLPTDAQRATNVGFGLTFVLPVLVALLSAQPGELVLIENPEAHLHPRGQAIIGRICALAASAGAQVVVESHSDHVLNAIRLAIKDRVIESTQVALQYFYRDPADLQPRIVLLSVGEDGMVDEWPPGFFDEMDNALSALLR